MLKNSQKIEVGKYKLQIKKIISQGAYGFVYLVENRKDRTKKMALKILISQNEERYNLAKKELDFLKNFSKNENDFFIQYIDSKIEKITLEKHRFFILLEFGPYGTLFNLIESREKKKQKLKEEELLKITKSITKGLKALHSLNHVHCDIKIENLLFYNMEKIKLCDFGSINQYKIDFNKVNKNEIEKLLEQFEKQTTFMYRPPEMCDPYLKYIVDGKVDIWMVGCVLFTLMFFKHPFLNSSKMGIINASYFWPEKHCYSKKLENLVRNLLTPDPKFRYTARELADILDKWQDFEVIELNSMAENIFFQHDRRNMGKRKNDCGDFDFTGLNKIAPKTNFGKISQKNSLRGNNIFNDQNNNIVFKETDNKFDFSFTPDNNNTNNNFEIFDLKKNEKKNNFDAFNDFNDNFEVQQNDYQKYNKNYNRNKTPKNLNNNNIRKKESVNEIKQQLDSMNINNVAHQNNIVKNKNNVELIDFVNELDKNVIGEKNENDLSKKANVNLDNPDFLSF